MPAAAAATAAVAARVEAAQAAVPCKGSGWAAGPNKYGKAGTLREPIAPTSRPPLLPPARGTIPKAENSPNSLKVLPAGWANVGGRLKAVRALRLLPSRSLPSDVRVFRLLRLLPTARA